MSLLATTYSSFLNSVFNYPDFLIRRQNIFNRFHNNIENILSIDFTSILDNYPKYDSDSQIISDMSVYNLQKIYNVSSDGTNYLIENIHKHHILLEKIILDKMPHIRKNFIDDYTLQVTYFDSLKTIYDKQFYFDLKNINKFDVFPAQLANDEYNITLKNGSFIQQFIIQNLLEQTYLESTNFLSKMILYFSTNDIINKQNVKDDFNLFIDTNQTDILTNSTKLILKSLYQFSETSDSVVDEIITEITPDFINIKNLFSDFSDIFIEDPIFDLCQTFNKSMSNTFAVKNISKLFNNYDYFNQDIILGLTNLEDQIIRDYKSNVTAANIQEYTYLMFFYKFWPFKFLNIIPYVMKCYVQNYLKTENSRSLDINNFDYYLQQIINSINSTNIETFLNNTITNTYFLTLKQEEKITEMTFFLYFTEKLDMFIETNEFNDYIETLVNKIFNYLSKETHVEYDFNWYKNHKLMYAYFKSLFRKYISNNVLFNNTFTTFSNSVDTIITNTTGDSVYDTSLTFSNIKIERSMNNLINYSEKLNNFFESHVTSTLISELSFDYITYFLLDESIIDPQGIGYWFLTDDSFIVT